MSRTQGDHRHVHPRRDLDRWNCRHGCYEGCLHNAHDGDRGLRCVLVVQVRAVLARATCSARQAHYLLNNSWLYGAGSG